MPGVREDAAGSDSLNAVADAAPAGATVRLVLLGLAVAVAAGVVAVVGLPRAVDVRAVVDSAGTAGVLYVVAGFALLTLMLAPRAGIAALAGVVFDAPQAVGYTLTGAILGASASFFVGRALGRDGVRQYAGERWGRVERWINRNGFVAVLGARLLPLVPFGLLNYGLGTTDLRARVFVPATLLGILPSTVVYVVAGRWAATDPLLALGVTAAFTTLVLTVAAALRYRALVARVRSLLAAIRH
jgi:uncharacterized membrane protein YdjX (TVP38/TMEM64 family)